MIVKILGKLLLVPVMYEPSWANHAIFGMDSNVLQEKVGLHGIALVVHAPPPQTITDDTNFVCITGATFVGYP